MDMEFYEQSVLPEYGTIWGGQPVRGVYSYGTHTARWSDEGWQCNCGRGNTRLGMNRIGYEEQARSHIEVQASVARYTVSGKLDLYIPCPCCPPGRAADLLRDDTRSQYEYFCKKCAWRSETITDEHLAVRRTTSTSPTESKETEMNINTLKARRDELDEQIAYLERLPAEPVVDEGEPNVIHFVKTFDGAGSYIYAAVQAEGMWYTTGPRSPKAYTWEQLIQWIVLGDREIQIWHCTGYDLLNG